MQVAGHRVLVEGEIVEATLLLEEDRIAAVHEGIGSGHLDAGSFLVLPGMVDIHGDAFERQWMPRPRVFFPVELALLETDRQLLANGITTAFHGLTVSWEPGLRGIEHGRQMQQALQKLGSRLRCDTRLHLRHEVFALDVAEELLGWIESGQVHLLGFNDHLEMIAALMNNEAKAGKYAERSGLSLEAFRRLLGQTRERQAEVPATVARLASAAVARNIPMASHDDESPAMHAGYAALGARICEFPVDESTARAALGAGSAVVMGGPNVVRGGSHANRMTATDAVRGGYCTVLASDYYYPSLLHAAFRLVHDGVAPLASAWSLVAEQAAQAAHLPDRGRLAPGLRADVIIVDDSSPRAPRVVATFVGGLLAYCAEPSLMARELVSA